MNKIKKLLFSGFFALMLVGGFNVSQAYAEVEKGPLELYYDCTASCIARTSEWTIRRTLCAADCYLGLVGGIISTILRS